MFRHTKPATWWGDRRTNLSPEFSPARSVQVRQAYFGRTEAITRNCAGTISNCSVRSSPILCMTPQSNGQIRLSGSITPSMRGSVAGRLPVVRLGACSVKALSPALAARVIFSTSTVAKAMGRSSEAKCSSASLSFFERLLCKLWFKSATKSSCRRVISVAGADEYELQSPTCDRNGAIRLRSR